AALEAFLRPCRRGGGHGDGFFRRLARGHGIGRHGGRIAAEDGAALAGLIRLRRRPWTGETLLLRRRLGQLFRRRLGRLLGGGRRCKGHAARLQGLDLLPEAHHLIAELLRAVARGIEGIERQAKGDEAEYFKHCDSRAALSGRNTTRFFSNAKRSYVSG